MQGILWETVTNYVRAADGRIKRSGHVQRASVPRGWLLRYDELSPITYVQDPEHLWKDVDEVPELSTSTTTMI